MTHGPREAVDSSTSNREFVTFSSPGPAAAMKLRSKHEFRRRSKGQLLPQARRCFLPLLGRPKPFPNSLPADGRPSHADACLTIRAEVVRNRTASYAKRRISSNLRLIVDEAYVLFRIAIRVACDHTVLLKAMPGFRTYHSIIHDGMVLRAL